MRILTLSSSRTNTPPFYYQSSIKGKFEHLQQRWITTGGDYFFRTAIKALDMLAGTV